MRFIKTLLIASLAAGSCALLAQDMPEAPKKRYIFNNGLSRDADKLRLEGDTLVEEITLPGGAKGERPYAISSLEQIDFPEPEELTRAYKLMAEGKAAEAGLAAERVMREFLIFRDVKGSYWAPAALVRIQSLSEGNRVDEARKLVEELKKVSDDPNLVLEGQLAVVDGQIKFKKYDEAQEELDALKGKVKGAPAGRVWLLEGDINFARGNMDEALRSYLRIPTLYPTVTELQARAYIGAIRIYQKQLPYSKVSLRETANELVREYPKSPEAALALKVLEELDQAN